MKVYLLIACTILAAGCAANKTQRAPSLVAATGAQPAQPQRNLLKEAGNTTWQVVTAPARFVAPPKKIAPQEPEVYQTPSAVIIQRRYVDDDALPAAPPAAPKP